jgi:hypothetical protein
MSKKVGKSVEVLGRIPIPFTAERLENVDKFHSITG